MQISMEGGLAVAGGLVFVVLILVALVCWCDRGDRDRWGHSLFTARLPPLKLRPLLKPP